LASTLSARPIPIQRINNGKDQTARGTGITTLVSKFTAKRAAANFVGTTKESSLRSRDTHPKYKTPNPIDKNNQSPNNQTTTATTRMSRKITQHNQHVEVPQPSPTTITTTQQQPLQRQQTQLQRRDPVYIGSSLVAGVGSGALSSVFCAPLDLLRTRLQVWSELKMPSATLRTAFVDIYKTEGWTGYFRGLGASLLTVPAFWGVYFPLYDDLKRRWSSVSPTTNPSVVHCGSAVLAGGVSDLICNPMFVVRTRLQTEALHHIVEHTTQREPSGIIRTIKSLYKEGGYPIFWRGMTANLMGLSHVAVQFPVYEYLKTFLVQQRTQRQFRQYVNTNDEDYMDSFFEPTALELFMASGMSKMCASLLSYPHEVIRSRMMDARGASGTTLMATISRVYAQDGMMGFYSGLPVALIRVIPNCCITFMTYELLLRLARDEIRKRRRKSAAAAAATTTTGS